MITTAIEPTLFTKPTGAPVGSDQPNPFSDLEEALNSALTMSPQQSMDLLRIKLFWLYRAVTKTEWKSIVENTLLKHPIKDIIHKDPFTYRAFSKPRGYAGDAVMIDYIYGHQDGANIEEDLVKSLYSVTTNSPSTRAVRNRLNYIVNKLNHLFETQEDLEVLSVACGHCREFEFCDDFDPEKLKRFIAMDQDAESLQTVSNDYISRGITPLQGSVTDLIKGKGPDGKFNLIYALGLYDYLNQRLAQKLTENMFNRLHSGGEVIVANFMPDILDIGYMESFMAWELILRDQDQMADLVANIDPDQIAATHIFTEPERNIVFLKITKK